METTVQRREHRPVVWAKGPRGVPVTCPCGYREYAGTVKGAYAKMHRHMRQTRS